MQPYVYWFLTALVLAALEMATGTFYILVIGIAFAVGGLVALAGFDLTMQIAFSAVAGVAGVILLQRKKRKTPSADMIDPNIGEQVKVLAWGEDGKVRVSYRGSSWDAELEHVDTPKDSTLYIKAMRGSVLILAHQKP
ncbi:MAG: NfeD family protein [Methylophilaceae bacterium]